MALDGNVGFPLHRAIALDRLIPSAQGCGSQEAVVYRQFHASTAVSLVNSHLSFSLTCFPRNYFTNHQLDTF